MGGYSTLLGFIFAGLLINAHFCIEREEKKDAPKQGAACYAEWWMYITLLGFSIVASITLGVSGWILGYRQGIYQARQESEEVLFDARLPPEEEENAVQIQPASRRDRTEDSETSGNPYSAFPPAAMYAHQ